MNLIDDPNILAPPSITPEFVHKSSQFVFLLPLLNQHPHRIHFYIASTFGCCLEEASNIRSIEPNSSVTLSFKVKQTNLLGGGNEVVAIYASNHKGAEQFPHNTGSIKIIRVNIEEESKVDPAVYEILEGQVDFCIAEAEKRKNQAEFVQALNKYEEGYEILRKSEKLIELMVDCRIILKDFTGAIRDIEAILLTKPNDIHFLLLKINVLMIWQEANIDKNDELFHYFRTSLEFVRDKLDFISVGDRNIYEALRGKFKKYDKVTNGEPNKLLQYVYEKSLAGYNEDNPISHFYASKQAFQQQLKEILLQTKHEDIATPEQVLDPINYQIMQKPYILPSGNSYQQKSLKTYFMTKGFIDPVTRKDVYNHHIFPNLALEQYIRMHPKLKQWEKYEYDFIHN